MSKNKTFDKNTEKKAKVIGENKKGRKTLVIVLTSIVFIVVGIVLFQAYYKGASQLSPTFISNNSSRISFPLSQFDDGKAQHFIFKNNDIEIVYFVLKSSDGVIRAAFDACDVCWKAGKGYYQSGDYMVCRNCGRRFSSNRINEVKGGCNPVPLDRSIKNGKVLINIKDILKGRRYFDFSGRGR